MNGSRPPRLVWYAGYGSNLCAARFRCYLAGGTPPGLTVASRGARDATPPRADRPLDIPHRLHFAGHSGSWGGAPAFVDVAPDAGARTFARAYLITWEQFEDVVAQENGRPTAPIALEPSDLAAGQHSTGLGPGRYGTMLRVGAFDDIPVVTFTSPATAGAPTGAPSPSYLKVMVAGLRESHALSDDAIVAYLGSTPGCTEALVASVLAPADESEG